MPLGGSLLYHICLVCVIGFLKSYLFHSFHIMDSTRHATTRRMGRPLLPDSGIGSPYIESAVRSQQCNLQQLDSRSTDGAGPNHSPRRQPMALDLQTPITQLLKVLGSM